MMPLTIRGPYLETVFWRWLQNGLLTLVVLIAPLVCASVALSIQVDEASVVELRVPLLNGTHYRPRDLAQQYQQQFGEVFDLKDISDVPRRLTAVEWASLRAAHFAGWLEFEQRPDEIILRLPRWDANDANTMVEGLLGYDPWQGRGLTPPLNDIKTGATSVLLIHGLESDASAMAWYRDAFLDHGVQVLCFEYPRRCSIATAGERLSKDLKGLAIRHPDQRIAIVAYSMGGLVTRYVLENPALNPGCITDVIFLGTPHLGSELAHYHLSLDMLKAILPRFSWRLIGQSGFASAGRDLQPDSQALRSLNRLSRPAAVRYHAAIGTRGLWTQAQAVEVTAEARRILIARDVPASQQEPLLRVLGSDELCSGRGDGAVSIRSAGLADTIPSRYFDLNHLELLGGSTQPRPDERDLLEWVVSIVRNTDRPETVTLEMP